MIHGLRWSMSILGIQPAILFDENMSQGKKGRDINLASLSHIQLPAIFHDVNI
jgi:hypothetical protein